MKKNVRLLLLMVALMVPWVTQAQGELPTGINCTFENDSDTAAWVIANGTAPNQWYIGNAVASIGSKSLYISSTAGASNIYGGSTSFVYAYTELSLTTGNHVVSFDWRANGEGDYDYLRVFLAPSSATITPDVTPNGGNDAYDFAYAPAPAGWIDLGNGKLNNQSDWQNYYHEFAVTTADNYKLVFFWANDISVSNNPPAAIDNVVLMQPTCPRPVMASVIPTIDSAYLSWTGNAGSYTLEYADSVFAPGAGEATVVTTSDTTYALGNLTSNTLYHYALAATCDDGNSLYFTGSFNTLCSTTNVPYTYGFETTDSLAECWTIGRSGSNASATYPYMYTPSYGNYVYEGTSCMYVYATSGDAKYWMAMPLLSGSLRDHMLSYYVKNQNSSSAPRVAMQVGYMTNAADPSTFVAVYNSYPNTSNYMQEVVSFHNVENIPSSARIAFMWDGNSGGSGNYFYLDNVAVVALPECPSIVDLAVRPSAAAAIVSWNYNANTGSAVPAEYEISYAPTSDLSDVNTETVEGLSYALSGLTINTEYKLWITPDCGNTGDSIVFTTLDLPCTSYSAEESDTVAIGNGTSTHFNIPLYSYYNYSYEQVLYKASDMGDSMTITSFALRRPTRAPNNWGYLTDLTIYMGHTTNDSLPDFVSDTVLQLVKSDLSNITINRTTGWVEFTLDVPFFYNGTDNLVVAFNSGRSEYQSDAPSTEFYYTEAPGSVCEAHRDNAAYDPATATGGFMHNTRPNIRFYNLVCENQSTCATPAVIVDSLSDTEVHVSWVPGYDETSWDVLYRVKGSLMWHLAEAGVSDQYCTVTGLAMATTYEIGVMGTCEDSLIGIAECTTECGPIYRNMLPYTANLENIATGAGTLPMCWTRGTNNSYPQIDNYTVAGRRALYFSSNPTNTPDRIAAVLPMSEVAVDSLEMIFDIYRGSISYTGTLIVGVMNDPTDFSTLVSIDTVAPLTVGTWETVNVDFADYDGMGQYIVLRTDGALCQSSDYDEVYVSNIQLMRRSACRPPASAYASNVTYGSADINVVDIDNNDAQAYVVYYGTENELAMAIDSVEFFGSSTTLFNLDGLTTYYAWVKVLCSDEESRVIPITFTTLPPCVEVENLQTQYSLANNTAVISWNAPAEGYEATAYVVKHKREDASAWTIDTTTNHYHVIYHLDTNVVYEYSVASICGAFSGSEVTGSFLPTIRCVEVGSAQSTNYIVPYYTYYNYSYSQSIYLSGELSNMGDTIRGLYYTAVVPENFDTVTLDVYIANTDLTQFSSDMQYVAADSLTLVASALQVVAPASGIVYIPFDNYFVRDANRNIVVAIDNNTGTYSSPSLSWAITYTSGALRTFAGYTDNADIDPANPLANMGYTANLGEWIPDVRFDASCELVPGCGTPMLTASYITSDTIALQWFAGGSETAWDIDYRIQGDAAWTNFRTATTDTVAFLTGLQMATTYEARLSTTCGGRINRTTQTYTTGCAAFALPYTENFTSQLTGSYAATCWQTGETNGILPEVVDYFSYGKMLEMVDGAYLVAPEFTESVQNMQVSFSYWGSVPGNFIYVGVITDPNSIGSFVPIDTIVSYDNTVQGTATVHFNNYAGTDGNICFYIPAGYPIDGSFYIDNLVFDMHQNCPSVDSIWSTASTSNSVSIAWSTDGVGTATGYIVEYGVAGFVPGDGTSMTTTVANATIGSLATSSVYDIYVTPICSTGDTMYPSTPYRFYSECGAMTVPFSMNFDLPYLPALAETHMLPTCWHYDMLTTATDSWYYTYPQIYHDEYDAPDVNTPYMLYTMYKAVVALPEMNAPLDTLQLSLFALSGYGDDLLVVGVVDSLTPGFGASFTPVDTIECGSGVYDTVYFCNYTGNGRYIAFQNTNMQFASPVAPILIDNVVIDYRPACLPISNIEVAGNSETTATIQWDAPVCDVPTSYDVEYGPEGFAQGSGTMLNPTTNTVTFTGLVAATSYDVYIRPNCSNGSTGDWTRGIFYTTVCTEMTSVPMYDTSASAVNIPMDEIPGTAYYNYSFSEVIYDSAMLANAGLVAGSVISGFSFYPAAMPDPANWDEPYNEYFTNCVVYMKHTTKTEFADEFDYELVAATDFVYTGDLNWDSAGRRDVIFQRGFTWDGSSNVIVAVDRNHGNYAMGSSFVAQEDTTGTRGIAVMRDDADINPVTGTGFPTYNCYTYNTIPTYDFFTCAGPVCSAPVVTVTTTFNEATLNWTSTAADFEVNVKAVAEANWPAAMTVNDVYTYTYTGLVPATQYQYRVRTICEEGVTSEWTEGRFTTDSLPCFAPSNLIATPTLGSAEMSWTAGGNETEWDVHVWNTSFDQTFDVTANPFSVTGLTPGTAYQAAIRSVCGGGAVVSEYGDTISFTTDVCDPVTDVVATVDGSSATVTWTAGENNTGNFLVEYGYEGFAAGTGTTLTATTNSVTITDLEDNTRYEVYVRAVCDGLYNSTWSSVAVFEIGIDAVDGSHAVIIYPNPAEQNTTISVSGVEGEVTVTIVDMNGRTVSTTTMECNGDCEKMMNVKGLAQGSYFVRLQGHNLNAVKKLVVK